MRARAGLGGWGRSLSIVLSSAECILMTVLGLGIQGIPDSPMSLSRPQFSCLRSSVLGSWAMLQKPGPGSKGSYVKRITNGRVVSGERPL